MKQYMTADSLQSFLVAIFFGLGATALALLGTPSALFVLVLAIIILVARHITDWLPYVLGAVVGVLLHLLVGIALPEETLVSILVVLFGSVWF